MTDDELREEVAELKARVRRLEQRLEEDDGNHSGGGSTGADNRDAAVLSVLRERDDEPRPSELVTLYKQHTDIINDRTAKRRAKNLRQTIAYKNAVGK